MLYFSESFVGGFFGWRRTYGAVARFECDSVQALEADWPVALRETAQWRSVRQERATALHLYFQVPSTRVWDTMAFVAGHLILRPAQLPRELRGLGLQVAVFAMPDMEQFMDLTLFQEATIEPRI
jgi:hypothetical protein